MAVSLLIKSGRHFLTHQDLWVIRSAQKSRTPLPSIFYHSFRVSYPMKVFVFWLKSRQVFINYRGEEVGHNFVSHLIDAFERHGIKFFVDKDEQRAKDLKHLFIRIEESSIGFAIFSTRYPESKWCMNEIVKIKKRADERKLEIIPIFDKVEPSDVRNPTSQSEFGKNFWRFMKTSNQKDPIQEWKEALKCISNKMGLSIGEDVYY